MVVGTIAVLGALLVCACTVALTGRARARRRDAGRAGGGR